MDYSRLKFLAVIFTAATFSACVTQTARPRLGPPKTFVTTELSAPKALKMSEQFLEWQKGYTVQVQDSERGLAVTDWAFDSPSERHRLTLRASTNTTGALLSTHIETQIFQNDDWHDIPSSGERESKILTELQTYLRNAPASSVVGKP